ncbi:MAG: hypothetical protein CFH06_01292 [Alphaproteobacteria bacterium MarineAlpha3_Bin5]|nr:hypothetical protein [Magnetovibrio sp.]PPR77401.1 MAG: hypothetical protein CFH06_01292 [Alphaproteobacteria bacterium MarineAlpha3_Bin5]|tara:strand:- start:790 stop:1791 length:1002 start_codon:yes stop_codon:yes gene_type:complete
MKSISSKDSIVSKNILYGCMNFCYFITAFGLSFFLQSASAEEKKLDGLLSNVVVDLSSLNQSGNVDSSLNFFQSVSNQLIMPPRIMPQSKLHVPKPGHSNFMGTVGTIATTKPVSTFTPPKAVKFARKTKTVKSPDTLSSGPSPKTIVKVQKKLLNAPSPPKELKTDVVKLPEEPKKPKLLTNTISNIPEAPSLPSVETVTTPEIPKLKKEKKPEKNASLATLPTPTNNINDFLQVKFSDQGVKLTNDAQKELMELIKGVSNKANKRLKLMAYANSEGLSASRARRLSLSRALAVRSFLIANGIRSTRIDVRALGNKVGNEPGNRVDINVVER